MGTTCSENGFCRSLMNNDFLRNHSIGVWGYLVISSHNLYNISSSKILSWCNNFKKFSCCVFKEAELRFPKKRN